MPRYDFIPIIEKLAAARADLEAHYQFATEANTEGSTWLMDLAEVIDQIKEQEEALAELAAGPSS